jgi:hypothetical protein
MAVVKSAAERATPARANEWRAEEAAGDEAGGLHDVGEEVKDRTRRIISSSSLRPSGQIQMGRDVLKDLEALHSSPLGSRDERDDVLRNQCCRLDRYRGQIDIGRHGCLGQDSLEDPEPLPLVRRLDGDLPFEAGQYAERDLFGIGRRTDY